MATPSPDPGPVLAIDSGSALASVAVQWNGGSELESFPQRAASERLLRAVEIVLERGRLRRADLVGVAAALGPGSFTGLRVGLATALGLARALGLAATGVPTLQALAAASPPELRSEPEARILALVDALRGACWVQRFRPGPCPQPIEAARRISVDELGELEADAVVAQAAGDLLAAAPDHEDALLEVGPLAAAVASVARWTETWDPDALVRPLYLAGPPVTRPGPS